MTAVSDKTGRELEPCPFCAGINIKDRHVRDGRQMHCVDCGASVAPTFHGPAGDTIPRATAAWNKRAALSASPVEDDTALMLKGANFTISDIEKRFPNWESFRDLVDCIDCTLHELRGSPTAPVAQEPVAFEWRKRDRVMKHEDVWSYVDYHTGLLIKKHPDKYETRALYPSPPATPAGVGADEIRSACIEHASLNMTVEAAHQQAERITVAILALLSRAGDQKRPHEA